MLQLDDISQKNKSKSVKMLSSSLQYDGSKDGLDWRIDFRYLNFIRFIKKLRSMLIRYCFIAWIYLLLSFFNLWLDFIRTSFFSILTKLIRSSRKFWIILKKNQLNWTIYTGFIPVLSFVQMLIYIIVLIKK